VDRLAGFMRLLPLVLPAVSGFMGLVLGAPVYIKESGREQLRLLDSLKDIGFQR
jgi:hypothetical protein